MVDESKSIELKSKIFSLVEEYYAHTHKELPANNVPISGKVYDSSELKNIVSAALDGWWTESIWIDKFEESLRNFLGVKHALTLNSGSSANLIALTTLTSSKLGDRRIKEGDEVITVAAGFPTTINPIIQIGAIPVFVDVEIPTYSINISQMREAL